jgi:hypothetical protein
MIYFISFRGRIATRLLQKRVTYNAYRKKVAEEITSSEKIYCDRLKILVKVDNLVLISG